VHDHRFSIHTSRGRVEVSWQITGVRSDAYARAHPPVIEEEKSAENKGRYVAPEAFGQPATRAIRYQPCPAPVATPANEPARQ
jgi:hypothetical protein